MYSYREEKAWQTRELYRGSSVVAYLCFNNTVKNNYIKNSELGSLPVPNTCSLVEDMELYSLIRFAKYKRHGCDAL